ncbi:NAD(P)H-hydrate epimerase [Adhaeretor mobilis]|uniref:NAD(P)H-hydrate epimerase n=1 Tax=Adhaeretor mobilis TaxID=1930276 RepID=A0A517N0I4_9BACT|nr:NAD(P)H-hydrate epimerase [Adhaeretor mobilis]QDT00649.1 Bifunctional NAD(P)H-hydrate repair enzyme Nnr [Adhaeretor mobilis]
MNEPPAFTREQSRRVDEIAINEYGFSGLVLMENAGRGACETLLEFDASLRKTLLTDMTGSETSRLAPELDAQVVILCGKGNNAGDGFVLARHLSIRGIATKVLLLAPPHELRGDALTNYAILKHSSLKHAGPAVIDLSQGDDFAKALDQHTGSAKWLVDALLGTGATGAPRAPYDKAIRWMNAQEAKRLALDLPTGLDCDSGIPADPTVRADLTCTFATSKVGFQKRQATEFLGEVCVVSIGVPQGLIEAIST